LVAIPALVGGVVLSAVQGIGWGEDEED